MNTRDLEIFMKSDPFIKKEYGGVLASNQLPVFIYNKPKIYICNLDPLPLKGTHWVAIYINADNAEYWDSLGNPPQQPFINFMVNNASYYKYVNRRIQGDMDTCGHFCLCYSYFRTRGYSLNDILKMFSNNLFLNDIISIFFYNEVK